MFAETLKQLKTAVILFILLTLLTGIIYPIIVTGIAQLFFLWRANGSFISSNNKIVGSQLIGQAFTSSQYFWGRPSATTPFPYNAANSSGSNLGPSNQKFLKTVQERVANLQKTNPNNNNKIPVDLVTASGSGLDPDISPAAAYYQADRIAQARQLPIRTVNALIKKNIQKRFLGILGEPRVNVLELNLALDRISK